MKAPRYKLGSQLDFTPDAHAEGEPVEDKFEWNLCLLDERGMNAVMAVPLGTHSIHHPIIRMARELVKLLNNEA
jgi:hypothetical protein